MEYEFKQRRPSSHHSTTATRHPSSFVNSRLAAATSRIPVPLGLSKSNSDLRGSATSSPAVNSGTFLSPPVLGVKRPGSAYSEDSADSASDRIRKLQSVGLSSGLNNKNGGKQRPLSVGGYTQIPVRSLNSDREVNRRENANGLVKTNLVSGNISSLSSSPTFDHQSLSKLPVYTGVATKQKEDLEDDPPRGRTRTRPTSVIFEFSSTNGSTPTLVSADTAITSKLPISVSSGTSSPSINQDHTRRKERYTKRRGYHFPRKSAGSAIGDNTLEGNSMSNSRDMDQPEPIQESAMDKAEGQRKGRESSRSPSPGLTQSSFAHVDYTAEQLKDFLRNQRREERSRRQSLGLDASFSSDVKISARYSSDEDVDQPQDKPEATANLNVVENNVFSILSPKILDAVWGRFDINSTGTLQYPDFLHILKLLRWQVLGQGFRLMQQFFEEKFRPDQEYELISRENFEMVLRHIPMTEEEIKRHIKGRTDPQARRQFMEEDGAEPLEPIESDLEDLVTSEETQLFESSPKEAVFKLPETPKRPKLTGGMINKLRSPTEPRFSSPLRSTFSSETFQHAPESALSDSDSDDDMITQPPRIASPILSPGKHVVYSHKFSPARRSPRGTPLPSPRRRKPKSLQVDTPPSHGSFGKFGDLAIDQDLSLSSIEEDFADSPLEQYHRPVVDYEEYLRLSGELEVAHHRTKEVEKQFEKYRRRKEKEVNYDEEMEQLHYENTELTITKQELNKKVSMLTSNERRLHDRNSELETFMKIWEGKLVKYKRLCQRQKKRIEEAKEEYKLLRAKKGDIEEENMSMKEMVDDMRRGLDYANKNMAEMQDRFNRRFQEQPDLENELMEKENQLNDLEIRYLKLEEENDSLLNKLQERVKGKGSPTILSIQQYEREDQENSLARELEHALEAATETRDQGVDPISVESSKISEDAKDQALMQADSPPAEKSKAPEGMKLISQIEYNLLVSELHKRKLPKNTEPMLETRYYILKRDADECQGNLRIAKDQLHDLRKRLDFCEKNHKEIASGAKEGMLQVSQEEYTALQQIKSKCEEQRHIERLELCAEKHSQLGTRKDLNETQTKSSHGDSRHATPEDVGNPGLQVEQTMDRDARRRFRDSAVQSSLEDDVYQLKGSNILQMTPNEALFWPFFGAVGYIIANFPKLKKWYRKELYQRIAKLSGFAAQTVASSTEPLVGSEQNASPFPAIPPGANLTQLIREDLYLRILLQLHPDMVKPVAIPSNSQAALRRHFGEFVTNMMWVTLYIFLTIGALKLFVEAYKLEVVRAKWHEANGPFIRSMFSSNRGGCVNGGVPDGFGLGGGGGGGGICEDVRWEDGYLLRVFRIWWDELWGARRLMPA